MYSDVDQFFDFHTTSKLDNLQLASTAVSIELQRDSGLLAIICDDHVVRIADIETRKVVRELKGFQGRVLDVVSNCPLNLCYRHPKGIHVLGIFV